MLSNDDSRLNEGVARVVIERAASNIFKLLIANIFRLDLFAHIRIRLVVLVGLGWVGSAADLDRYRKEDESLTQR